MTFLRKVKHMELNLSKRSYKFLPVENHFINLFHKTLLEMHFFVSSKQVYKNGFTKLFYLLE